MQITTAHRRVNNIPVLEYFDQEAGQPLPLVIVLHGFTGRKEDLRSICQMLAGQGYYATAIDLHLHGEAGPTPFDASATVRNLSEVIERSCNYLDDLLTAYAGDPASRANPSRIGLLGISLGGVVIYRFLERHARQGIEQTGVRAAVALIAGLVNFWPETLRRARPLFPAFGVDDQMIEATDELLQASPPPPFLSGVSDFPLLMQYGKADPIVPVELVREAFQAAQARYQAKERLELIEYENCGHETPLEMLVWAAAWFGRYLRASE